MIVKDGKDIVIEVSCKRLNVVVLTVHGFSVTTGVIVEQDCPKTPILHTFLSSLLAKGLTVKVILIFVPPRLAQLDWSHVRDVKSI